ncbi:tetratricopeptide repeat protein [candidate division KSB1 bacterium]|nr:MAG: tetratricopeptide repeat protein [candidate division KSB1 bacterium]
MATALQPSVFFIMNNISRRSRRCGVVWAILMIAGSLLLPREGTWTIDDGVKRIAAYAGSGLWAESVTDGPIRSRLAEPSGNPPLLLPFAERESGGFALGFSPWARVLYKHLFDGNHVLRRLAPALISIITWIAFEWAGVPFAFLLLPLTFYGLIPWEHALSWLFAWPAIWLVFSHNHGRVLRFASGLLLSAAIVLRHETAIIGAALAGYEVFRNIRDKSRFAPVCWFVLGALAGSAALLLWQGMGSEQSAWIQLQMNRAAGSHGFAEWFGDRLTAVYHLLFRADRNIFLSCTIILLLLTGAYCLWKGESGNKRRHWIFGLIAVFAATAIHAYRLWQSPLPPMALMGANSLLVCLPWTLLLLLPPYRHRPALWLGVICILAAMAVTPVWEGVHWGPRVLLFAVPLFILDLASSQRARGRLFTILMILTLIQTAQSGVLGYARQRECSDHVRLIESKLGSPVMCPTTSQCADLASLWKGREFFTAGNPRELRQLLIEMRFAGVDTVWLHLGARDPLYIQTFPEAKPVRPHRMSVIQAGNVYRTMWRVYELVMNRADTLWAEVLEKEAGSLLLENRPEDALKFQMEAVTLLPMSAERHHNLALIYAQSGKREEARKEAIQACELNPALAEPVRLLELLSSPIKAAP